MNTPLKLAELGQSIWYDNIQRSLLQNGSLAGMILRGEIRGITSNPSIFMNAITNTTDYAKDLSPLTGVNPTEAFFALATEDIQAAADLFRPLYDQTHAADGYVSLEVSPYLAYDPHATFEQGKETCQAGQPTQPDDQDPCHTGWHACHCERHCRWYQHQRYPDFLP